MHEKQPAGVTHLHNDTVPTIGGDTIWASGYSAYEKLSPDFRKIIDGKKAVYRSAHPYVDRDIPTAGLKYIERVHPLVRVHPATGWKALWVNRAMTERIVGLDQAESDLILNYLYDVFEKNIDIQVRFRWTPRTSALWDNRYSYSDHSADMPVAETDTFPESQSITQAGITKGPNHGMVQGSRHWLKSHISRMTHRPEGRPLVSLQTISRYMVS